MKRLNTMFDVAFSLEHVGDPEHVSAEALLNALQKRVDYLRQNPQEAADAFGINDSYEIAPLLDDANRSFVEDEFVIEIVGKMTTEQLRDYAISSMGFAYCKNSYSNPEFEDLVICRFGRDWLVETISEFGRLSNK